MSGCYGNDPEDRHFEAMLHTWEDSQPDDESRDTPREREESGCDSDDI